MVLFSIEMNAQDSSALVALYQSTDGPNWTTKTGWEIIDGVGPVLPISQWFGVTVSGGDVVVLALSNNNLKNDANFSELTGLVRLSFSRNELTSVGDLSTLTNLIELQCSNNELTSLGDLSQLTNLQNLTCIDNLLTDTLDVSSLSSLRVLSCGYNQLTHIEGLSSLTNISSLWCNNNQLTNLGDLSLLELIITLGCNNNQLTSLTGLSAMTNIERLYCENNQITAFEDLSGLDSLEVLYCQNNQLEFGDLRPVSDFDSLIEGTNLSAYIYAPQDTIGFNGIGTYSVGYNDSILISLNHDHANNKYDLYKDGYFFRGNTSDSVYFYFDELADVGTYHFGITNDSFPDLTLYTLPAIFIPIGEWPELVDSLGSPYDPHEVIIVPNDTIDWERLDSILVHVIGCDSNLTEICDCDGPRVYTLPDQLLYADTLFVGADAVRNKVGEVVASESLGGFQNNFNYQLIDPFEGQDSIVDWSIPNLPTLENDVKVMVVDWGVDLSHPFINDFIQTEGHTCDNFEQGILVLQDSLNPLTDELDHGSHITGVIVNTVRANEHLSIVVAKLGDEERKGTLFGAICAMHHAEQENVDVINLSLGYRGIVSPILMHYMNRLEAANILVVTSAGNDTINLDVQPEHQLYFPASIPYLTDSITNLVSVGAYGSRNDDIHLSGYSNYGNKLHVLAPGNRIWSAVSTQANEQLFGFKTGTSISAAMVSGVLASLKSNYPNEDNSAILERFFNEHTLVEPSLENEVNQGRILDVILNDPCNLDSTTANDDLVPFNPFGRTNIDVLANDEVEGIEFTLEIIMLRYMEMHLLIPT